MEWPSSFYDLRRGDGCPMCAQGRPEETEYGTRILAGEVSDAYLQKAGIQLNFDLLGNSLPHLHAHVIPRHADDPRPGWPFPFPEEESPPHKEAEFRAGVDALSRLLA